MLGCKHVQEARIGSEDNTMIQQQPGLVIGYPCRAAGELVMVTGRDKKKKLDLRGKIAPGIMLKKKTFSYKSRKPPNLYPTHT